MEPRSSFWRFAHRAVVVLGVLSAIGLVYAAVTGDFVDADPEYVAGTILGRGFWVALAAYAWRQLHRHKHGIMAPVDTRPYVAGMAPPQPGYVHHPQLTAAGHPPQPYVAAAGVAPQPYPARPDCGHQQTWNPATATHAYSAPAPYAPPHAPVAYGQPQPHAVPGQPYATPAASAPPHHYVSPAQPYLPPQPHVVSGQAPNVAPAPYGSTAPPGA
ncbi:MAG: hypothetical protein J7513_12375 [Solirubrobacteraceae bacterium]|nr:hypothetical protein [Solirubrobacteraceae bacterium]